jgi:hypothetical protein
MEKKNLLKIYLQGHVISSLRLVKTGAKLPIFNNKTTICFLMVFLKLIALQYALLIDMEEKPSTVLFTTLPANEVYKQ